MESLGNGGVKMKSIMGKIGEVVDSWQQDLKDCGFKTNLEQREWREKTMVVCDGEKAVLTKHEAEKLIQSLLGREVEIES